MEQQTLRYFRFFYKTFLRGLLGILPLTLSVYVVIWFFHSFGGFTDRVVSYVFPFLQGVPGMGLLVGGGIIFLLGFLFSSKRFLEVFAFLQFPFKKIPLIKTVYSAVEDMMFYFSNEESQNHGKVVTVKLPNSEIQLLGLLTRDDLTDLNVKSLSEEKVAVFIPMSYALGGYTVFVPRSSIELTDMKVEVAMKSALTAWMKKNSSREHSV